MLQHLPHPKSLALVFSLGVATTTLAESVDLDALTRIRQEGFRHSKVMEHIGELCDRIGPRLTASPNGVRASEWTRDQFEKWGLTNAHMETWGPFGEGWSQEFASLRMLAPDVAQLYAIPRPWTPSTDGAVRAKAIQASIKTKDDIAKFKGKLAGKIVFLGDANDILPRKIDSPHYSVAELDDLAQYRVPGPTGAATGVPLRSPALAAQLREFLLEEKPLAIITPSRGTDGTIFVQASGSTHEAGKHDPVPYLAMAVEHFSRITRLLARKVDVELELNVATTFHPDNKPANTLAEIAGSDRKLREEVVMLGAHLDSWTAGTGATDNAVGCAVVMEAMRILQTSGVKLRRTVRAALWTGEEEGLLGSKAYVSEHFASRMEVAGRDGKAKSKSGRGGSANAAAGPLKVKPEHAKLAAYFNLDNGAGKVRGIYTQENASVVPIFEAWIAPLKDLGVTHLTQRNTGSTDHVSFDNVGLPGFQFIQDELDYSARTHHSNMDVPEHLKREDLAQASVVMAWFVYNAANRDEMLPRKPMPPEATPPKGEAVAAGN